jgi:hypothetical protein
MKKFHVSEWSLHALVDGRRLVGGIWNKTQEPYIYESIITAEPTEPTMATIGCLTFAPAVSGLVSLHNRR